MEHYTWQNLDIGGQSDDMSQNLRVAYIYMESPTKERFETASDRIGWAYKSLAQQCIHAFFKKHQGFYVKAAKLDYTARGMDESDYYRTLRDGSEDDLKPYLSTRPDFGTAPLAAIPLVKTGEDTRQRYGVITLSDYNLVLLRVCQIVDMGPMSQVISRIVKLHFDEYWETNYLPQIELDDLCKFTKE